MAVGVSDAGLVGGLLLDQFVDELREPSPRYSTDPAPCRKHATPYR